MTELLHTCCGFCARCQTEHRLPMGSAKNAALDLIQLLDREKRLDFDVPPEKVDSRLATDYLFGKARGKMFGVMACQRVDGATLILKSFSGQYNGVWDIPGWAPPLFDLSQWHAVNDATEKEIKKMGRRIDKSGSTSFKGRAMIKMRAKRSRALMKALHQLYLLHNFRSERRSLPEVYIGDSGIPNGTADCCGPKLLNYAACNDLRPLGIAEFYFGRPNKQGDRRHGHFYPPCRDKCGPILGFMLCGLNHEP